MTEIDERQDAAIEELVARARAAVPTLAAHADQTERNVRVAAESLFAATQVGAFAMTTPSRYGGLDVDTLTMARVLIELGRGCGSTAWFAGNSCSAKRIYRPFLSETASEELFADPNVRLCGSDLPHGRSTEVAGGFTVSGRWGYASGCEDAAWALVGAPVYDGDQMREERKGPLESTAFLIPTSSLRIAHTWDVVGLRGTGSHTLIAEDVFVPASHVVRLDASDFQRTGQLVAATVVSFAPLLGVAQAALDLVTSILGERRPPMSAYANLTESPQARHTFAEASLLIGDAHRRVCDVATTVDGVRPEQHGLTATEESRLRLDVVTAARQCRHALELLLDLHGSSSFSASNPLQRMWRDLAVGTRHGGMTSYLADENYARAVVGVE